MAIVTDDVELIQDFTKDKHKLKSKLDSLLKWISHSYFGKSKQYSALLATLNEAFNNEDQRPIVIFQTDGDQLGYLRNSPLSVALRPPGFVDKKYLDELEKRQEAQRVAFSLDDIYRAAEKARATIWQLFRTPATRAPSDEQIAFERTLRLFKLACQPMPGVPPEHGDKRKIRICG
jgi:hypothetical protein